MDLGDLNFDDHETFIQSYAPKQWIDGVTIIPLRKFCDDGGSFMELARISNGALEINGGTFGNFHPAQINLSYISPGVIKAWHFHLNQEDLWFVPPKDKLVVGLFDGRTASKTHGVDMRFVLGDGKNELLLIPRGVAHGCANLYEREMQLVYIVNQKFDLQNPDEHRIRFNALVDPDFWKMQNG